MSSLAYFFKESLRGFTRNLSTALGSIVTIFLSLLIIGVFLVGGITVDNVMKSVESEVSITAYVADDASEADIQTVEDFVKGLEGVSSVSFTTKEQALENFRAASTSDIIDSLDGMNPLPASIDVELPIRSSSKRSPARSRRTRRSAPSATIPTIQPIRCCTARARWNACSS